MWGSQLRWGMGVRLLAEMGVPGVGVGLPAKVGGG